MYAWDRSNRAAPVSKEPATALSGLAAPGPPQSSDVVELLLEWWPDRWCEDLWWCLLAFRCLGGRLSSTGSPWTIPFRASIPPFREKFRQTMKARMAAFS
jgi:hypothetical protein